LRTNRLHWQENITLRELRAAQLERINQQLFYMADQAAHWSRLRERFPLSSWEEFQNLPTMDTNDILIFGSSLVCTSQRQVKRIVSQNTSGTNIIKRIYFTDMDLQRTEDFFFEGMQYMCRPGDRALILLPGTSPDGVSDLLRRGLSRFGVKTYVYGAITDYEDAAHLIKSYRPDCIIGMPIPVRRLALMTKGVTVRSVLLSADHVPPACKQIITEMWGSDVFEHYGMTETCFGLAVECPMHTCMHLRNDAFYVEALDPLTDHPLPPGQAGMITVTSLQSEAMPLLRYKTGDVGILTEKPCTCGLAQPAIERILGRYADISGVFSMASLDDILSSDTTLHDWSVRIEKESLQITVLCSDLGKLSKIQKILQDRFSNFTVHLTADHRLCTDPRRKRTICYIGNGRQ